MFEYLMPLARHASRSRGRCSTRADRGAVRAQIDYGEERGVPWGVSESAYNVRDRHLTYQYRAFGVPDLALKRDLGRDLVVAPYASALAAMLSIRRARWPTWWRSTSSGRSAPTGSATRSTSRRPAPGRALRRWCSRSWRITSA